MEHEKLAKISKNFVISHYLEFYQCFPCIFADIRQFIISSESLHFLTFFGKIL